MTTQRFLQTISCIICSVAILPWTSHAIVGSGGASGDSITQKYIDYGAQFGNTVGFIDLGGSTGTGIFVPSTNIGEMKFLTAAHNVVDDNGAFLNNAFKTIYFGANTGPNGGTATFAVLNIDNASIVANPLYGQNGGQATHDMAVITFRLADMVNITGGAAPVVTHVSTANPQGQTATLLGHGGHGMGASTFADADPDGVLKGGQNIVDLNGVPAANTAGTTVSDTSGQVLLTDLDGPSGANSSLGAASALGLEAGTATGDSGGPLMVMVDGKLQVVGVLNGGDNPNGNASEHGDIGQYATPNSESNQAFLIDQGVFLGSTAIGTDLFTIVDIAAIADGYSGISAAQSMKDIARQNSLSHLGEIKTRIGSVHRGTSILNRVGGAEVQTPGEGLAGIGSGRWQVWAGGNHDSYEHKGSSDFTTPNNRLPYEISQHAFTVGVEYLINENTLGGVAYSHADAESTVSPGSTADNPNQIIGSGASADNTASSVSAYLVNQRGPLSTSFVYSFTSGENELSRDSLSGRATASPDSSSHVIDLTAAYQFQKDNFYHGPTAGFQYASGKVDGYSETATSSATRGLISVGDQDYDQTQAHVGYTISYHHETSWGLAAPYVGLNLNYVSSFDDATSATFQTGPFQTLSIDPSSPNGLSLNRTGNPISINDDNRGTGSTTLYGGMDILNHSGWSANLNAHLDTYGSRFSIWGVGIQMGTKF